MLQDNEGFYGEKKTFINPLRILFLVIVFILFLLVLNYFAVIRINSTLPVFSFLPHIKNYYPEPTPYTFPPTTEAQENYTLQNHLNTYAKQINQPKYSIEAFKADIKAATIQNRTITFSWGSLVEGKGVSEKARMEQITPTDYDSTIRLSATTNLSLPLNADESKQLVNKYFLNQNYFFWNCMTKQNKSVCTTESEGNRIKNKMSVWATSDIPNRVFILFCSTTPSSKRYNQDNYCLL